ncbi:STAS domain-containing protein [Sphaerisporangium viridialbum]|uniref:STAS domain-containing protein n=1 Tax=Sphaerisporangium viridialbum TaxID=46189 RepID=UPI003C758549
MDLNVAVEIEGHRVLVHLTGEIDIATADLLSGVLDAAVQHVTFPQVELDMSQVSFMDCSGLRVLVPFKIQVEWKGGTFILTNVSTPVDHLLSAAGFDHRLDGPRSRADRSVLQGRARHPGRSH